MALFDENGKVSHGQHNEKTQTALCSFAKLGVYKKLKKNIPEWLKLRRCAKILLHEIGHLFGMGNCEFFRCLMNSDVVLDCVPLSLCPICLSKLYFANICKNDFRNSFELSIPSTEDDDEKEEEFEPIIMGGTADERERRKWAKKQIDHKTFNLRLRYKSLATFFEKAKCFREATFYKNRLQALDQYKK